MTVVRRLPMVHAAMLTGALELKKAEAFAGICAIWTWTPRGRSRPGSWTGRRTGRWSGCGSKLRCAAIDADPASAKQRYDRSVSARNVRFGLHEDGTASIEASWLPAGPAVEAKSNIERLARAAKAAGDKRLMPQLRADAYLDLLRGIPFRLAPTVDAVTAQADAAERAEFPFAGAQDAATTAERMPGPPPKPPRPRRPPTWPRRSPGRWPGNPPATAAKAWAEAEAQAAPPATAPAAPTATIRARRPSDGSVRAGRGKRRLAKWRVPGRRAGRAVMTPAAGGWVDPASSTPS